MNPAKYTEIKYINFLIATQKAYSCSEAERVQADTSSGAARDAINRLLHRVEPDTEELWQEAKAHVVALVTGILVLDNTMMDKWYAQKIELVSRQWSRRHKRVVRGICLVQSDESIVVGWRSTIPCDYRLYYRVK